MRLLPFVLLLVLACAGCRTNRQTQTEYVYIHDTDTLRQVELRLDSIVISDSVVIFQKGDTVYKEKYHTEYRDRLRVDTLTRFITQKLYYTKTEEKEVEVNRLYWWQKALMWAGGAGIFMGIIYLVFKITKIISSRKAPNQ